ncbi:MAG: hypothetical protein ACTSWY_01110, partial [Promethearchaeota archaeon]
SAFGNSLNDSIEINVELRGIIIEVDESSQVPEIPYSEIPYQDFTNYRISGIIKYDDGTAYSGSGMTFKFTYEDNISTQDTIDAGVDGTFEYYCCLLEDYTYYTLSRSEDDEFLSTNGTFNFKIIENITITFSNLPRPAYVNESAEIRGNVLFSQLNGLSYPLSNSTVTVSFLGMEQNITTDNNGIFQVIFNVPINTASGNYSCGVELVSYHGDNIHKSNLGSSINDVMNINTVINIEEERPPPVVNAFPYEIIIIIVVAVAAVIGIFFFQRWRLKNVDLTDKKRMSKKVDSKQNNAYALLSMGRIKEAIAYLYLVFVEVCVQKFKIERKSSWTLRDFAIMTVKSYAQNPSLIYPFMQNIEKVVYGGKSVTLDIFREVVPLFAQLYSELTGKDLFSKLYNPNHNS